MLKRKIVSGVLVLLLLASSGLCLISAHAAEQSAWVELLETATVNDSGRNWFNYSSTATVSVPAPYSMRLTKIDLLITYPENTAPTKVEVFYNGTYYQLEMRRIDSYTSRVFGSIQQNFYSDVRIRFSRSSSASSYLEILSCRVSQIVNQEVQAQAQVLIGNTFYATGTHIDVPGSDDPDYSNINSEATIRIDVQDWMKFDELTVWGSASSLALGSVRVNVGTLGVPFTVSYLSANQDSEWSEWVTDYGGDTGAILTTPQYFGKYLYCITIDLSSLDRTYNYGGSSYPMYVYLTGTFPFDRGYTFNCQYVNGSIFLPDKTEVAWWNRFTAFMSDLFGGDTSQSDQFQQEAQDQANEFDELNSQVENFTRPDLDDMDFSIDSYVSDQEIADAAAPFGELVSDPFILVPVGLSLTVALVAYVLYGKR